MTRSTPLSAGGSRERTTKITVLRASCWPNRGRTPPVRGTERESLGGRRAYANRCSTATPSGQRPRPSLCEMKHLLEGDCWRCRRRLSSRADVGSPHALDRSLENGVVRARALCGHRARAARWYSALGLSLGLPTSSLDTRPGAAHADHRIGAGSQSHRPGQHPCAPPALRRRRAICRQLRFTVAKRSVFRRPIALVALHPYFSLVNTACTR